MKVRMGKARILTRIGFVFFFLTFIFYKTPVYAEMHGEDSFDIGVTINGEEKPPVKPDPEKVIPKDNIYEPSKSKEIGRLLPQTGETILSFIIILIGFSVVLLLTGVIMLKHTLNEYSYL